MSPAQVTAITVNDGLVMYTVNSDLRPVNIGLNRLVLVIYFG